MSTVKTSSRGLDDVATSVRRRLLRLAAEEDARATAEAAQVRYWEPCPASVLGHRAAATALRAQADRLIEPYELLTAI